MCYYGRMQPERFSAEANLPAPGVGTSRLAVLVTSSYASSGLQELVDTPSQIDLLAQRLSEADAGFAVQVLRAERGMAQDLEDLLTAAAPIQSLLFFFSGYVVVSEEEIPSLLLDGDRLSTLSLRRVRRLVSQSAASACVVLDTITAFEGGGDQRQMVSRFHEVLLGESAGIHLFASNRVDGAGPSPFASLFALCLDWHSSGAELAPNALFHAMRAEEAMFGRIECAELFQASTGFQILVPDASRARSIPPEPQRDDGAPYGVEPAAPPKDALEASADALFAAGDVDGAIAEYARLLEHLGSIRTAVHAPIYAKVGAALRASGQVDDAFAYYEAAIDIDPNLVAALSVAAELRAERGDAAGARELYVRWLALDSNALPALEKAAEALAGAQAWDELVRLYSAMLSRVTDPEIAVDLAFHIDGICREKLDNPAYATAALERAAQIAPDDATLRLRLSGLCEDIGDHEHALTHLLLALRAEPGHVAGYRRAMRLFDKCGRPDGAWNAACALEVLGEADVNESLVAETHRPEGLISARDSLSEMQWTKRMLSPESDAALDDIFGALGDAVMEVGLETAGRKRRVFAGDPSTEQDPKTSTITLIKTLAWSTRLLGVGLPKVHIVPELRTSFAVPPCREPTIVVNKALASGLEMPELAFLWSRQLAFLRPEYRAFRFFPSVSELAALLLAALSIGGAPGVPLKKLEDDAKLFARGLRRHLGRDAVARLETLAPNFPLREASTRVRAWARSAELTASRTGLLASGSTELAAKLIERFPLGGGVDTKDQVRDLLAFSVSEPYASLRDRLGVAIGR
jgi:tetratricopeptide (TPR) repeat protein